MQMLVDLPTLLSRVSESSTLPLIAAFMFGFVFLAVLAVTQAAQSRQAVRRRAVAFNPASPYAEGSRELGGSGPGRQQKRAHEVEEASELLFAVEKGLSAKSNSKMSNLRRSLIRAGYFSKNAVGWYYGARLASAGLFALAFVAVPWWLGANFNMGGAIIGAMLGLIAPTFYLRHRHRKLQQQCRLGFPNFLDLLVVCAESGLTPRAGIERVSREITRTHPFLGANLFLMSLELNAGRPLVEAVAGLGRRIGLDEVRSLGSLLQQTEELGTNLTNTLRVFSEDMRARRFLRAEEQAHALPVKLVLPLAIFVFPVMLVVSLMPVLVRIQKAFF